jgi:hypothetical protein
LSGREPPEQMLWPIIVLVSVSAVALVVYFITGSVVRYNGGITTCPQMLPHYQTWRAVAINVRDAACFIAACGRRPPKPPLPVNPFDDSRPFSTLPSVEDDDVNIDDDGDIGRHNNPVSVA